MRVAIVGCGNIANRHALALSQLGFGVSLVVNHTLAKAQAFREQWNAEKASDQFETLLAPEIDCVHVCTPPALHYQMVKQLLEAGKHVVCEKPLCLSAAEARELMDLGAKKHLLTAVNFNVRYHEACQRAKTLISSEEFGAPCLISGSYKQEFHVLPNAYMWRYIPSLGGDMRAVTEIGSHWIDLVRYWTGLEITAVSAAFGKFSPDRFLKDGTMYPTKQEGSEPIRVDSEDAAAVTLRFSNGALGSLLLSEVSHGRNNAVQLEVSSARKSVWWCSEDPYRLYQSAKFAGVQAQTNAFGGGFPDTFTDFFRAVYASLEKGDYLDAPQFPTFYDGYRNAAVCEAIFKSAENNSAWMEVQ